MFCYTTAHTHTFKSSAPVPHPKMNLKFISSVPRRRDSVVFGQIGGLATGDNGDVYVFHRGSRIWNSL